MLHIIEIMLFIFVSILTYFTITLFYLSYEEKNKAKQIKEIEKFIDNCILEYNKLKNNKLNNKILKNQLGLTTLVSYSKTLPNEKRKTLKKLIVSSKYYNYLVKTLKTNDINQLIFNVKLIGELEIKQFRESIYKALNKSKKDIYLQYNVLLALAKLNDSERVLDILLNKNIDITERALKNVFDTISCNKTKFYKKLLKHGNTLTKKTVLYQIGFEGLKSLEGTVIKYLKAEDPDLLIAAISASGNLRSKKSLNKIKNLINTDISDVKKECIIAMNLISESECKDELIKLLNDNDFQIKYTSAMALSEDKDIDNVITEVNDDISIDLLNYAVEYKKLVKGDDNDDRVLTIHSTIR